MAALTLECCRSYLRAECVRVPLQDLGNGLFPNRLVFYIIAAAIAIAIFAVLSTREALTIELKAARVLAVAVLLWLLSPTLGPCARSSIPD